MSVPFAVDVICPKCGCDAVPMRYCSGGYSDCYPGKACYQTLQKVEHMHRHCPRCHYEWFHECIEQEPTR